MVRTSLIVWCGLMLAAAQVAAQQPPPRRAEAAEQQMRMRPLIVMEGMLQQAVHFGAQDFIQRLSEFTAAAQGALIGRPQVEGFLLRDYGPFFAVRVPQLSGALTLMAPWQSQSRLAGRLRAPAAVPAPGRVISSNTGATAVAGPPPAAPDVDPVDDREFLENLEAHYVTAIVTAIKAAMVENSANLPIGADDVLTVAAAPDTPSDPFNPSTRTHKMILRVKGSVIEDLRQKRIDREQAMSLIEVENQ